MDGCDYRCSLFIGIGFLLMQWLPVVGAVVSCFILTRPVWQRNERVGAAALGVPRIATCAALALFALVWSYFWILTPL